MILAQYRDTMRRHCVHNLGVIARLDVQPGDMLRERRVYSMKCLALACLTCLLASTPAMACQFDTDCQPGSQCLKASSSIYGVCTGGLSPGDANDRQPAQFPLDINGTYGNTCSFDTDCGPGSRCIKQGAILGVCMK